MYHQKLKRFKYIKFLGIIEVVQYHLCPNHHNVPKYIYEDLKINYFSSKYYNYKKSLFQTKAHCSDSLTYLVYQSAAI